MPVLGYLEALDRFGLPELKQGDLQIKDGNIAVTADGDWQFGNTRINALFRHVERWRLNQPTRDELYAPMLITSQRRKDVLAARSQSVGASLVRNPVEFHEEKNPSPCRPARCSGYSLSDRMPDERVLNALRNACLPSRSTTARHAVSLRPRQSVRPRRFPRGARRARHGGPHESQGKLLGQCSFGELLLDTAG